MRTYERTHPWIRFHLDLRRAPHGLWLLLGESQSQCEHIAGVPLLPRTARALHQLYLAKGARATTAIEGNTLTEDEVRALVEEKLEVPKSREYLRQEVQNIVDACDRITAQLATSTGELTVEQILGFDREVLDRLPLDAHVVPGAVRTESVRVGKDHGAPPEDCAWLLDRLCGWLNEPTFRGSSGDTIAMALLRAVIAHLHIAWIHPFGDGNGRTARLVEHFILLSAGVPSPAAHLLSNHYDQTRSEYYRQLQAASDSGGDGLRFIRYAVQGFVDGLREQLGLIREQQMIIAWRDFVAEAFRDGKTAPAVRQRDAVLELSAGGRGWVAVSELPALSPRLASAYAGKSAKTLTCDVNALRKKGLIEVAGGARAGEAGDHPRVPAAEAGGGGPGGSRGERVKLPSWNIGRRPEAWSIVADSGVDVALLRHSHRACERER